MTGCVYLIGAGPGDPGLLTLRGRDLLAQADVVVYDRLVSSRLLEFAPPRAERIYAGKSPAAHTMSQEEINRMLVEQAKRGRMVVRLKGGDPFVFGRGGEEALALAAEGIPFEVVPGVTAGIAAAAYAGIPVTHRNLSTSIALITGHEDPDKAASDLDWPTLAKWNGTLAFYMGMENVKEICAQLEAHGMPGDRPAAAIRMGTRPDQRTVCATVGTLGQAVERAQLQPPAIILIGPVVQLRESLQWFERRPLFGKRIINTRPVARAADLTAPLTALGAEVMELPTIAIEPLRDTSPLRAAIKELRTFDWLIFTSAEGVTGFFAVLDEMGLDARALAAARLCAVGTATAERLRHYGLRTDLVPGTFTSAAIAEALPKLGSLSGKKILCPRADIAPASMTDALRALGVDVVAVAAYHVVAASFDAAQVIRDIETRKIDWVTFTSPSAALNFFAQVPPATALASQVRLASIGPVTTTALRELGLQPTAEASPHTMDGMVQAIVHYEQM